MVKNGLIEFKSVLFLQFNHESEPDFFSSVSKVLGLSFSFKGIGKGIVLTRLYR